MIDLKKKQNEWAEENSSHPYVTPKMQIQMWRDNDPKGYDECLKLVQNETNIAGGLNKPNGNFNGELVDPKTLQKDLTTNKSRSQRPTDFSHLRNLIKNSKGKFNHTKAGYIDLAEREDGSQNVWDHWHTGLFAVLAEIPFVKVDTYKHTVKNTEQARMLEQEFFYDRNGLSKPVGESEEHEKNVERKRRAIIEGTAPKFNIDVAIDDIMTKTGLTSTGRLIGHKQMDGLLSFKNTYKKMRSHYKKNADKSFIKNITQITKAWPNDKLLAYFLEGFSDLKIRIDEYLPGRVTEEDWGDFIQSMADNSKTQKYFTNANKDSGKAKNEKGKASESISLRILYYFNTWWKRPQSPHKQVLVNQKLALKMYNNDLTDLYIKATIHGVKKQIELECPNCQHDFKHAIED